MPFRILIGLECTGRNRREQIPGPCYAPLRSAYHSFLRQQPPASIHHHQSHIRQRQSIPTRRDRRFFFGTDDGYATAGLLVAVAAAGQLFADNRAIDYRLLPGESRSVGCNGSRQPQGTEQRVDIDYEDGHAVGGLRVGKLIDCEMHGTLVVPR